MNTYQVRLCENTDKVIAHIIANSEERAIELFKMNYLWFLGNYDIVILSENVTDKHGIPLKEKIKIF
jgi:hypothetical protein